MTTTARRLIAGRYRLGDLLGEGAMSTVSCAHDEVLDRPVALKLLKPAFAQDPAFVERFYGEARAAARIVHPHIVSIFDVVSQARVSAVVMEYVDGPSIADVLRANGRIDDEQSIGYGRAVAQALAAAHAQGVVHRDLKPANILLTSEGCLKVADFGLGAGTPEYAPPEQLAGGTPVPAWDLYSLGAVLRAMSGGAPGPRLQTVIEHLMDKDPARRYASAEEADAALAAISEQPSQSVFIESPTLLAPVEVLRQAQHDRARAVPAGTRARTVVAAAVAALGAALATVFERLRDLSGRHVEPQTDRAVATLRAADRRYLAVAAAGLCLLILLFAALNRPRIALADLRRTSAGTAHERLRAQGLAWSQELRADERIPADRVIAQDPAPGTRLRSGDTVHLIVSSGLPLVSVPNLLGETLAQANLAMAHFKLHPKYAAKITDDPPNTVIAEIPAAGSRVRERGDVVLVISTGPNPHVIYTGGGDGGD